jgi:predicted transport protein
MARIIYNVTVNVENEVRDEWVAWMRDIHIPDVMRTGKFVDYRFTQVMVEEESGSTYSIQYMAASIGDLKDYQNNHAPALQREHSEKFPNKYVAFRTILKVIDQG